jgi:prepilin-type N-terminal cleavage/methylation domain-containing protein
MFNLFFKNKTYNQQSFKGFTLVELMISVSIIGLITAVVVFNQGDLSDQISLNNVASEIDLQVREAQVYGISVRERTPSSNDFDISYGVDLNISGANNPTNTAFYTFADRGTKNGYFDTFGTCSTSGECIFRHPVSRGNTISQLCVITSTGSETCGLGRVAITFVRPSPSAKIVFFNSSGNLVTYSGHRGARITLTSPKGKTKDIVVYTTGQVSID